MHIRVGVMKECAHRNAGTELEKNVMRQRPALEAEACTDFKRRCRQVQTKAYVVPDYR